MIQAWAFKSRSRKTYITDRMLHLSKKQSAEFDRESKQSQGGILRILLRHIKVFNSEMFRAKLIGNYINSIGFCGR